MARGGAGRSAALPSKFDVLEKRSIFSRERPRVAGPRAGDAPALSPEAAAAAAAARASQTLVLRGVVLEDAEFIAFLEDSDSGRTSMLRVGDAVAGGRVTDISLAHIEFAAGGRAHRVEVGHNLEGAVGGASPTLAALARPTTGSSTAPAAGSGSPNDVLEKMRLKRLQEMGGK